MTRQINISKPASSTSPCSWSTLAAMALPVSMMFAGKSYVANVAHREIRNDKASKGPPR